MYKSDVVVLIARVSIDCVLCECVGRMQVHVEVDIPSCT